MAEFETTTRKGRVVYNRRKHYFKMSDLKRIWERMKKDTDPDNGWTLEDIKTMRYLTGQFIELLSPEFRNMLEPDLGMEEKREIKGFLANTTIDLMIEIIEKVPFIPQRLERTIAEFIYWNMIYLLDSIIYPNKEKE